MGIAGSARAWAVLRVSSVESRFEALHTSGLTALVGRDEETELLLRRWTRAKTGEGQVVLIAGKAGIGKSRLTAELLERLAAEPHTRLRYFCSPQHMDSAFYPIIGQMERAAGLAHGDTPQGRRDKLGAVRVVGNNPLAANIRQDIVEPWRSQELTRLRSRKLTHFEIAPSRIVTISRRSSLEKLLDGSV